MPRKPMVVPIMTRVTLSEVEDENGTVLTDVTIYNHPDTQVVVITNTSRANRKNARIKFQCSVLDAAEMEKLVAIWLQHKLPNSGN